MIKRLCLLAMMASLIQACALTKQAPPSEPEWGYHSKFILRSPEKRQSGNLVWKQFSHSHFEAKLWGALGMGTTIINGDKKGITIDNGKEVLTFSYDDTVQLLPGLELPLGQLAQQASEIMLNADPHSPKTFDTDETWQARTLSSVSYTGFARPTKIRLQNESQNTSVQLVITRWF